MLSLCVVLLCSSGSYKWGGIGYLIGFFIFVNVVSAIVLSVIKRDRGHKSALVRHAEDYVTPTLRKQFIEKQLHSHRCASWAACCLPSSASFATASTCSRGVVVAVAAVPEVVCVMVWLV